MPSTLPDTAAHPALLALHLLATFDPTLLRIVGLSLAVSLTAAAAAALAGLPAGAALAVFQFPGRSLLVLLASALLGLPPVVVGLALYLAFSRSGMLGGLGLLFTPWAMIVAQFLLAVPIVVALSHRTCARLWATYGDELRMDGARRLQAIPHLLRIGRLEALTAVLAGFGRSISEVGAILVVGGNIAGYTRTMTTAITLETSQGHFAFAMALGLVLVALSLAVSLCAFGIEARSGAPFDESTNRAQMKPHLAVGALHSVGLAVFLATSAPASPAAAETIVLASTTSVENSGLLAHILPAFTGETGIEVHVIAQGTGQALATAAHGDADLVLVHDPDAEAAFIAAGHGAARTEIAWNDFIFIGPEADPANIASTNIGSTNIGSTADALGALRAIAAAGAPFVSRGDNSGTDALEKRLWRAAGIAPSGGWYRDIGGGMGAALNAASAMGAYTISDRGTWLSYGRKAGLRIVLEGDRRLLNRYDVILLNPAAHPGAKQEPARRLADWLSSPRGQDAIAGYQMAGQRLFHPEADLKP